MGNTQNGDYLRGTYFYAGNYAALANRCPAPNNDGHISCPMAAGGYDQAIASLHSQSPTTDWFWTNNTTNQSTVLSKMASANLNVVVAPYFGAFNHSGRHTDVTYDAYRQLWVSASTHTLTVMPALEASLNCRSPLDYSVSGTVDFPDTCPNDGGSAHLNSDAFDFQQDIASNNGNATYSRLYDLISSFGPGNAAHYPDNWTRMYDRNGTQRLVVNIIHAEANLPSVGSSQSAAATSFSNTLASVVSRLVQSTGQNVGFTFDTWCDDPPGTPAPNRTHYCVAPGDPVLNQPFALGTQNWGSEIPSFSLAKAYTHTPPITTRWIEVDDYPDLMKQIADAKKSFFTTWVNTGFPTFMDVSPGYDASKQFPGVNPKDEVIIGDEGDVETNAPTHPVFDQWRNVQAEAKGRGTKGYVAISWNDYPEGNAFTDTTNSGSVSSAWKRNWLKDFVSVAPQYCDEEFYSGGQAAYHLYGAICVRYTDLDVDGELGYLGKPVGQAVAASAAWPGWSYQPFESGRIYWSGGTGAKIVHGLIYNRYAQIGYDAGFGPPITDELPTPAGFGRYNAFQGGGYLVFNLSNASTYSVYGAIGAFYAQHNFDAQYSPCAATHVIGLPIAEAFAHTCSDGSSGAKQQFQGASISWCNGVAALTCP